MKSPGLLRRTWGRLFPPSARTHDIHTSVPVDISHTHAVRAYAGLFGDSVDDPGGSGMFRIRLGIRHCAIAAEQNFGFSVAIDVFEQLYLSGCLGHDVVTLPAARFASRVYVEINRTLIHHQNIRPAVAGEIVGEVHHT